MRKDGSDFPSKIVDYSYFKDKSFEPKNPSLDSEKTRLNHAKRMGLYFGLTTLVTTIGMSQVAPKQAERRESTEQNDPETAGETEYSYELSEEVSGDQVETSPEVPRNIFEKQQPSFESPFEFSIVNEFMSDHNLTTRDLFYPSPEKISEFQELYSSPEILPIFSDSVMKWSDLVERKCNEYNSFFPEYKINPNFILAIMSIESRGVADAESHMGARGLLQMTQETAKEYGYSAESLSNPEKNIEVALLHFRSLLQSANRHGLEGSEIWEYAAMKYNGGWNADKYFMTGEVEEILKTEGGAEMYLSVLTMSDVKNVLNIEFKTTVKPGYEYWKYGPRMVRNETLKYREKLVRFAVIAQMAAELKSEGISDEDTRKLLETPKFVKNIMSQIKKEMGSEYHDYFEERDLYNKYLDENITFSSSEQEWRNSDDFNFANYLMYP